MKRNTVSPDALASTIVKFWPILTATLVFSAGIGGAYVRLASVENRLEKHEQFFRSMAVNQYLVCRMVNKNASQDEKLKCDYPGDK